MSLQRLSILRIDSSSRSRGSVSRRLADLLLARLADAHEQEVEIVKRDVANGLPFVDQDWIEANFTEPAARTSSQRQALSQSDALVEELKNADVLVLAVPIYNFGIPATLKAWIDMVARARETFRYTDSGPEGLLVDKKAYLVVASGGTEVGSEIDFATTYLRHVLGFLGISDVEIVAADRVMARGEEAVAAAEAEVVRLTTRSLPTSLPTSPEQQQRPIGVSS